MGLISGIAGTEVGNALTATANDWSQSADRMALAQVGLQGHREYANALFNSREQVAQIQADAKERVAAMAQENAQLRAAKGQGQLDPAQALADQANISLPEARGRIQANEQGQPYQPSGPDGKIQVDPSTGQPVAGGPALTPAMAQILARVHAGNAYGGNMEQQGKGAVEMNTASAGNSIIPTAAASTDPNQVGLVQRAMRGEPLTGALGGGNGTFSTMGQSTGGDLNDLGQANAEAAPLKAEAAVDRAAKGAKDNDFIHANAVLQASEKRLAELDTNAAKIRRDAITPPQQRDAQAQLASIAQERQQVQQQYEQARQIIMPGAGSGNNALSRFWKQ